MTLVVDANVALSACATARGFDVLGDEDLVAPRLMWSECLSGLREARWRDEVTDDQAESMRARLDGAPIARREVAGLADEAWRIAEDLGHAKTYGAEYLALARLLGCRMVTLDARLRRGADRLDLVVGPAEL